MSNDLAAPAVEDPSAGRADATPGFLSTTRRRHLLVALAAFVGAGVLLVYVGRALWFFGDEWDFILHRDAASLVDLMRPHNEHWSAIPILVYRATFSIFSLESYLPYLGVLAALHVTIAALVYVLLVGEGAPWGFGIVAGVGVVLFGPGAENLVWAFQIGFVGSLAAFLGAVVCLRYGSSLWSDVAAAALLVLSVMSSGLGVAAVGAALVALLIERSWRRALRVTAVPIAVGIVWFLVYSDEIVGAHDGGRIDAILLLPSYVAEGFTAALQGLLGYGGAFGPLVAVLVVGMLSVWILGRASVPSVVVIAPLTMALFVLVLAGLGRSAAFGPAQAAAPRYVHVVGVLLLVGLGAAFFSSKSFQRLEGRTLTAILIVAACVVVLSNVGSLRTFAWNRTSLTDPTKSSAIPMIVVVDQSGVGDSLDAVQPVPLNPDIDVRSVRAALDSGRLRLASADVAELTDADLDAMRARLQVRWSDQQPSAQLMEVDPYPEAPVELDPTAPGCWDVTSSSGEGWVVLRPEAGGAVRLTTAVEGTVSATSITDGDFIGDAAATRTVGPGEVLWLDVAPNAQAIRVDLPAGGITSVCVSP
jgi:hypothetical protein